MSMDAKSALEEILALTEEYFRNGGDPECVSCIADICNDVLEDM